MLQTAVRLDLELDRIRIEDYLGALLAEAGEGPVGSAMRYAVLGAGQRLRPLLALRAARLLDAEDDDILRTAAAVELVHCASLIVDDLPCMDNSPVRRNRPATHVACGEPMAVLAAFSLIALSARSVVDQVPSGWRLESLIGFQTRLLSTLDCRSLVGGQALDLLLSGATKDRARSKINELKTAPLFQLAMHAGAVYAVCDERTSSALDAFGREFGLAYQLADDYRDGELHDRLAVRAQLGRARHCLAPFGKRAACMNDLLEHLDGQTYA